jgi:RimJ/RimL family protein N-acetyltransferase
VIVTSRLRLVPATVEILEAELRDPAEAAALLGAQSPPDWPPLYNGPRAFAWSRDRLREDPAWVGWATHYVLFEDTVVGTCGYKGPPDDDETVEIGYSVVPSFQRRGIASEAAQGLVANAFARGVRRVRAHTLPPPDGDASIGVLRKLGFDDAPSTEDGAIGHALDRPA